MTETNDVLEIVDTPPPSPRQVLLGWFVVAQLAFLIVSNVLGLLMYSPKKLPPTAKKAINQAVPNFADEKGHIWEWSDQFERKVLRPWTQLTGQEQGWSLFAPTVAEGTGFPAVVLLWDDAIQEPQALPEAMFAYDPVNGIHLTAPWMPPGSFANFPSAARQLGVLGATHAWDTLTLHAAARPNARSERMEIMISENEPKNVESYLRISKCRVRRYESQLFLNLQPYPEEKQTDLAARVTDSVRELVRDYHDATLAFLKWRRNVWQRAHPDQPTPKQVLLFERFYRIHGPDDASRGWDPLVVYPIARWRPQRAPDSSGYVLEAFNFTTKQYQSVP